MRFHFVSLIINFKCHFGHDICHYGHDICHYGHNICHYGHDIFHYGHDIRLFGHSFRRKTETDKSSIVFNAFYCLRF